MKMKNRYLALCWSALCLALAAPAVLAQDYEPVPVSISRSQISMNGNLYRVTPIDFGSLFNYFVTRTTPGYVLVDCNSGEAKLVRYEGLKYMKSAYFSHDLYRRFFFADPCAQYGSAKFELDDEGKPYWIVQTAEGVLQTRAVVNAAPWDGYYGLNHDISYTQSWVRVVVRLPKGASPVTHYDLKAHQTTSGKSMEYLDSATGQKIIPYVIEPSLGADRAALAFLCEAYEEEELEGGDVRTVMHFHPALAPFKCAVLPLQKNKLGEKATEVYEMLSKHFMVDYDETGSIGKRYRRQDEVGTPMCITVDFDTLEDQAADLVDYVARKVAY